MKSHTEYLTFNVPARMDFVNITRQVEEIVRKSGVQEGLVLCNAMHITASVFINDDEPGLHDDYKKWLEELAPFDPSPQRYQHNRTGEDNADAHHKRQIMGREVVVAITKGKLDFGPWEQIFYGEFDGRAAEAGAGQGHRGVDAVGVDSPRSRIRPSPQGGRRAGGSPPCSASCRSQEQGHSPAHRVGPDLAAPRREMAVADPAH